jgi:hypothetical protein
MQRLITQKDSRPCLICSQKGTRHAVEVLPDGGILIMVAHDDGRICKWAEYSNNFGPKPEKKKGVDPTYIICPECHKRGRLNWKYDLQAPKVERPFSFKYLVVHEKIGGTWGKVKTNKRRRCQSFTREQRISILKQIGRYISDPPIPPPNKKPKKERLRTINRKKSRAKTTQLSSTVSKEEKGKIDNYTK